MEVLSLNTRFLDEPESISSQENVIMTSTCECLSPHERSDFSNTDESIGRTSWELLSQTDLLSVTLASQCQKHETHNKRTVCEESMNLIISKSPEKNKDTQDVILNFKQPVMRSIVAVKWKPPGNAIGEGILTNRNLFSTGIRLGLSRNCRARKLLHPNFQKKSRIDIIQTRNKIT